MLPDDLPLAEIVAATAHVDIHMPPPDDLAVALFVFGTNQPASVTIAAERYLRGGRRRSSSSRVA
ncbi:MAG TPA: hypothetical protein VGF17_03470 [Phytomonospora sp.]